MDATSETHPPLYPEIEPNRSGYLAVGFGHEIYWEECGNPAGLPVVFLHGGPGGGCSPTHRRFFDPKRYRIVLFDQRGAGRSRPLGALDHNTTQHLVGDIESIRKWLGVERWLVFGGSWGSTLALAYGISHPQRCLGFVLRGIFLGRKSEIDWFLSGLRNVFPEAWRAFAGFLPEAERGDLMGSYHIRLTDPDPAIHMPAARAWSGYEGACSTLRPDPEMMKRATEDDVHALGMARLETHYFLSQCFLGERELLDGVAKLRHLPAVIVQGRYDMVCPIVTADELHHAWPEADYIVVPDAGHAATEPGTRAALVAATDRMAAKLGY
ncbi:MAG: prolyl aminopeptidase [Thalassobaculales bacterium]